MLEFKTLNKKNFTLIEILVVIAIIAILAAFVVLGFQSAIEKAKITKAKAEVKEIYNALILLANDTGDWPGHKIPNKDQCPPNDVANNEICTDGCAFGLASCESGLVCNDGNYSGWREPYIKNMPKDPWGNDYFFDTDYTANGQCKAVLGSYGPNGEGLNNYDSDNILYIITTTQ